MIDLATYRERIGTYGQAGGFYGSKRPSKMHDNKHVSSRCALIIGLMMLLTSILCIHAVGKEINAQSERGFGKGRVGKKLVNRTTGMNYLLREMHNKTTNIRSNINKYGGDIHKYAEWYLFQ